MKRLLTAAAAMLLVCTVLASCSQTSTLVAPALRDSVTVEYDSAVCERGDVVSVTAYDSYVRAVTSDLCFEKEFGSLGEVCVKVGDSVAAGDVIAKLDCSGYDAAIERARSALTAREERLATDTRKAEINIELAKIDLSEAKTRGVDLDIKLAQLEVERLTNELEQLNETAEMELIKLRRSVADAEAQLSGTVITAPRSGEVVLIHNSVPGTRVTSNSPIVRIADPHDVYVQYDGTDTINNSVLLNKRAVALVGDKQYELEGILYPQDEYTRMMLAGIKPPVRFGFETETEAEAGDFAEVLIYAAEARDVLRIPANALYLGGNTDYYVYVIENGEKIYTEITIGVHTNTFVEVTGGIEEGDVVLVKQ